jgi:hypothetical protein
MEGAAGRKAVDQFDSADFDDAFDPGIEPGRFRIEDDLAHRITPERQDVAASRSGGARTQRVLPVSLGDDRLHWLARGFHAMAGVDDEIRARRFSASGTWRARIASNFSAVMPGRARTRSRWIRRER